MTVRKLIEKLQGFYPDHEVILSSDPEGNSFFEVETIEENHFAVHGTSNPVIQLIPEPDDDDDDATPCVVIWP